ncbi:MAG TPA: hypothetical protein PLH23_11430 [Hyphomonadaceae bacterium]|nr:hypothetical protein [Hyphomonadaceae bacterium]HPI48871.1 hypothetical protein [Hyphomonadaceae bacterium]
MAKASSSPAGYSVKTLIAKLGWMNGSKAVAIAPPANYAELTDGAAITAKKTAPAIGSFDFIHLFVKDAATLSRDLPKLEPRLATGGMIWVSWPKKSSKLFIDLTEDGIRKVCLPMGLVDVKVCALDADWSGLKLYRRK